MSAGPQAEQRRERAAAVYSPAEPGRHAGLLGAARILAHFLDVPVAGAALIDHGRIRLAPGVGHGLAFLPRDCPCLTDVLDGATVVVPDTAAAGHPAATGPFPMAAWAAAPIRTAEGDVIGALFAADHRPRAYARIHVELLEAMAGLVMAELVARRNYVAIDPATRQFESLLRDASDTVAVLDPDGGVAWMSPALTEVLGYDSAAADDAIHLIHLDDMPLVVGSITVAMARIGITGPVEFRMAHHNRTWRTMEAVFSNLFEVPSVGGVVVYLRDVTERRRHADLLAAEARVLTGIARRAPLSDVLRGIIELVEGCVPGCNVIADATVPGGMVVTRPDGRPHTPSEQQVLSVASSLTTLAFERHDEAAAVLPSAVVGRQALVQQVEEMLRGAAQRSGKVAVLLVDLDRFKEVNRVHGHETGDQVLPLVARRLSEAVRPHDVVVRMDGDEFVVVCDGVVGELEAVGVAERINLALFEPIPVAHAEVRVTASIGIAMTHGEDDHAEALLRDADAALYNAKQRGRGRFEVFSESRRRELRARRQLDGELEQALEAGELRVWLQPEVELTTGRVIGFEALARWQHPERGLLAPGEFIPQAERSGLIERVGGWVLDEACRLGRRLRDAHDGEPFVVAVNLSAFQLSQPTLPERVEAALAASGLRPSELCLELTESALMEDADLSLLALRTLKNLGVRLAIDDFGTGYSSLSYLRRFPIDAVKIDRSFVSGLGRRPEDGAIVTAVLTLARALGLSAIAEGVEQRSQRDELIRLGCGIAQGFLFSPPRPADELLAAKR